MKQIAWILWAILAVILITIAIAHAASGYWATWKSNTVAFYVYMGPFSDVPACTSFGTSMGPIKDFTFIGCFDQIPQ